MIPEVDDDGGGIEPSQAPFATPASSDALAALDIEGSDGFLKSPVADPRGFTDLEATDLEPDLRGALPNIFLSGLGVLAASAKGGTLEFPGFVAEASEVRLGVAFVRGVLAIPTAEVLRGVPLIVDKVLLNGLLAPRKPAETSSCPALDPGRLPCLDDARPDPSEL